MIVTEIYNGQGLGNQLWCYVVTRVIAKDKGLSFGIAYPEKFKCNDFLSLDFGEPVTGGAGPEGGPPITLPEGIKYYYKERKLSHPINNADISRFDSGLLSVPDSTKIDGNMQDEQYIIHHKKEIREWLKVKNKYECKDYSSNNICIINFRGGEYVHIEDVFLPQKYWDDAIKHMLAINSELQFIVITDDVKTAKKYFPRFEVFHFNIAKDYSIINNANYLILSNSSFAWFPAWTNTKLKFCIAPKYWWAHNLSDGYWACDYNITSEWHYLDREGKLYDYVSCLEELHEYKRKYYSYYYPTKIKDNFVVVSNYNNEISWIPEHTSNYLIYDRSDHKILPPTVDINKVIKSPNIGYNIYDYLTFIIDNYEKLPDCTIFMKGNTFPRHVSKFFFEGISNNNFFTPIEDPLMHNPKMPSAFISSDGGFNEINNSWYIRYYPVKYFYNYNDFLKFCFKDPVIPDYVRFAPGGNYIVPKNAILKYPKIFYDNLRVFVSHTSLPGEAHIVERALYTIWTCNFEISEKMKRPISKTFIPIIPPQRFVFLKHVIDIVQSPFNKAKTKEFLKRHLPQQIQEMFVKSLNRIKSYAKHIYPLSNLQSTYINSFKYLRNKTKIKPSSESSVLYRRKNKIYDAFYFFNEIELLEIRLNILDPYVDYFVLIEATETFSGLPKIMYYEENKERFKKFRHKIIHYKVTDTPVDENDLRKRLYRRNIKELDKEIICNSLTTDNVPKGEAHWLKEFYQKESLKKALVGLSDDDFVYISDVDEIWNPLVKIDYSKDNLYKYRQVAYYYYLNNRSNDDWASGWTGTVATKYKNIEGSCVNHLRTHTKNRYTVLQNGGWHFTFQGGVSKIRKKLESYGHKEFNTQEIRSNLENTISNNLDYRGRNLKFKVDEKRLPKYLLENRSKYLTLFK